MTRRGTIQRWRRTRGRYNRGSRPPHAERHRPHTRFRLAVHPADRAPAARALGLLRDPAALDARRVAPGAPPARDRALGRSRQRAPAPGAALRPEAVRAGRAGGGDLLRHAADEPRARRRGEALGSPRVRAGGLRSERGRCALPRAPGAKPGLGEPRRRRPARTRRLSRDRLHRDQPDRRDRGPRAPALRDPVPPRGRALRGRHQGARQLPRRHRLPPGLERALVRGGGDRARARAGGPEGPRDLRAVGRRRLGGGGADRPARDRLAAHLRVRGQRPAAQGRGAAGAQALRAAAAAEGGVRRRLAPVSQAAGRGQRSGAQAQDHRPRVHRGVPCLDAHDGQGRLPGAGHALPGRDRVGLGARPLGGDQEPPQRGRPARRR